jgi:hypothetical protein
MSGILGAVITDGPNTGRTVGECLLPRGVDINQRAQVVAGELAQRIAAAPTVDRGRPIVEVPETRKKPGTRNNRTHRKHDRKDLA